jgi:SPX domain protein involved in polyphosphate accumulation
MNLNYRYEIKFIADDADLSNFMEWLYFYTSANKVYKDRIVNSIYFDDSSFSCVKDNLAGIAHRRKLRLRWYGENNISIPNFEEKIKNGRLGYKKTYQINSIQNSLFDNNLEKISCDCQKELLSHNVIYKNHITPTLLVKYKREYFQTFDDIRVTIDHNIQFSEIQLYSKINDLKTFSNEGIILEIKFDQSQKETVAQLIKPLHSTPKRHSKYLTGLAKLGQIVYL